MLASRLSSHSCLLQRHLLRPHGLCAAVCRSNHLRWLPQEVKVQLLRSRPAKELLFVSLLLSVHCHSNSKTCFQPVGGCHSRKQQYEEHSLWVGSVCCLSENFLQPPPDAVGAGAALAALAERWHLHVEVHVRARNSENLPQLLWRASGLHRQ